MPQQIVLQLPINDTDSRVVLYSKSDNTGLIRVGQSGKRYVEMNHEESYSSESQAVLLTASYITVMPGGVPKPSLVIGGYGLVSDEQHLDLQLDDDLVQPEHQVQDSDNGLLYFLYFVSDAEESETIVSLYIEKGSAYSILHDCAAVGHSFGGFFFRGKWVMF